VVVHLAAVSEPDDRAVYDVNVTGTLSLAHMAIAAGAQTFIFVSSQSAHPDALSAYGRSKYAAEQALLTLKGIKVVIVRPGFVCGPGSRGLFQRLCGLVGSLPVLPLLAGGQALVQPIHVDDLCQVLFQCTARAAEVAGSVLCVGDPTGLPLAQFLQAIAVARLGKRKFALPIPLWPVELAVRMAEMLRLPLPINSENLQGMRVVRRMETSADMARLGVRLRSLDAAVQPHEVTGASAGPIGLDRRAVRVLLLGAGRVGLVHALTLSRLPGCELIGVLDRKRSALKLLRGMGLRTPGFASLDEALRNRHADAAVIATPPSSHLGLARACLSKGLHVLIEKPLAIRQAQLADYQCLAQEFPHVAMQVGYVMPRNPQVRVYLERLRAGEFGTVQGFMGLTLLSLIQHPHPKRWEVRQDIAGGGALINAGGHVLSMIQAAFGDPIRLEAQALKRYAVEVEDSIVVTLQYPDFQGVHYCSWSMQGFPRQENTLIVWTTHGQLILTGSVGMFICRNGEVDLQHQLDFDVGFNLAPDYAGAGFSTEIEDLKRTVQTGQTAPMDVAKAIQVEELLFRIYAHVRPVERFECTPWRPGTPGTRVPVQNLGRRTRADAPAAHAVQRVLDLRDLSAAVVRRYLSDAADRRGWDAYLLLPSQLPGVSSAWLTSTRLRVTVPDFLQQSRLLSAGRYGQALLDMGIRGLYAASLAAIPAALRARGVTFWAVAMGLLAADLTRLAPSYNGCLLLHSYLTDLALVLERKDMLERMLHTCRRLQPQARIGVHTHLAAEAANVLPFLRAQVDDVSVLTSPQGRELTKNLRLLRQGWDKPPRLTAEVGLAPAVVHQLAAHSPQAWLHGAEAIVLGVAADETLAAHLWEEKAHAWSEVFPGLPMPEAMP
jgi:predicted dehydrogenase/uncharacterized protein YbjT (DUF2867 family)